jgi:uncharacterized protein YndB with AHSA1/START domain
MTRHHEFTVRFHHPVERVFSYLADARNRAEWQSSLRRIEPLNERTAGVGARWRDVTWAGIEPVMEVVTHEPCDAWAEQGEWHGVTAYLSLAFTSLGDETDVDVVFWLHGRGLLALPVAAVALVTPRALRADLERADRILATRRRPR